jgi:hypothetical protein
MRPQIRGDDIDMSNIKNAPSEDNDSAYADRQTKSGKNREFEIGQWPLDSLYNEIHSQLDSKWIKDKKDGPRKRKYRERARLYTHHPPVDYPESFYIDSRDLPRRVIEELESLDYETADYVMKEVIGRIFDSIGELYLRVSVRRHVDWEMDS